jgi:hypothetical protein
VAEVIQRAEAPAEVTNPDVTAPIESTTPATEVIQPTEVPAEVASQPSYEAASQPSVASVDVTPVAPSIPAQPTAAEAIQRAETPIEAASHDMPASVEPTTAVAHPPTAAEIIQRAEALTEVASQPSYESVASEEVTPATPSIPAQPGAAEVIQRAEAPAPGTPMDVPSTDLQPVDLFEALNAASDIPVARPQPTAATDVDAPSPVIQRSLDDAETYAPTQPPSEVIQRTPDETSLDISTSYTEPEEPLHRAVDDELLSWLHALQSSKPPPASNAPKSSAPSPAPAPVVQRQIAPPVQKTIQREITVDSSTPPNVAQAESEQQDEVDVDRLARDVYKMLQNRLRIERERRDRL